MHAAFSIREQEGRESSTTMASSSSSFPAPFFARHAKEKPAVSPLISPEIFVPLHKRSGNKRKRKRDVGKIRCRRTIKSDCLFALCASRRALFFDKRGEGICCLKSSSFGLARAGFYFFLFAASHHHA